VREGAWHGPGKVAYGIGPGTITVKLSIRFKLQGPTLAAALDV
jgi:hypothetical protein